VDKLLDNHVFAVMALADPDGGLTPDFDCLPDFVKECLKHRPRDIRFRVAEVFKPSAPGGYMVRHKEFGIFQGDCLGMGFWYPMSEMPEQGLAHFFTRTDANEFVRSCVEMHNKLTEHMMDVIDFEVTAFDHSLEVEVYNEGRWVHIWEERPVPVCPTCGASNPKYPDSRWFKCMNCEAVWDGVYCPITGVQGYCKSDCACHLFYARQEVKGY